MSALTELQLKNAKPSADKAQYEIRDGKIAGLFVRVSKDAKTFVLKYRFEGRSLRLTIGRYPDLSLLEARNLAQDARSRIAKGVDPQAVKKKDKQKLTDRVDGLVAQYIVEECKGPTFAKTGVAKLASWRNKESNLRRSLVKALGTRSIHNVTDADITRITKKIVDDGKPQAANNAFRDMSAFFAWCRKPPRKFITVSPSDGLDRPAPSPSRDRVVSDAELAAIWAACDDVGYPYGHIVKLLMLTGQRRTEVAGLPWAELDLDAGIWELPKERTKNDEDTIIPLSTLALDILRSVPRLNDTFVFPARGNEKSHFSGYSKAKKGLDDLALIDNKRLEVNWTQHDLRRTLSTNLAKQRVLPHVIEHIVNHKAASMSAVSKIYNKWQYLPEKREALQLWSHHIEGLVKQAAQREPLAA